MEPLQIIRPELLVLSPAQIFVLIPYFILFLGSVLAIFGAILKRISPKWPVFLVTIFSLCSGLAASWNLISAPEVSLFNGMMTSDSFSHFFNLLFMGAGLVTAFSSMRYLDREGLQHPEYFILLLFSVQGMMLLTSSLDLIVLFIALELMSLCVYVLVGFRRADRLGNEAAMKYFILGSAASAALLYGVALLYGATGSTEVRAIASFVQAHPEAVSPMFALGAGLLVVGFFFKVAAVPFHMWMPDVYEGAPVPITGFMTTGLKAAAFGAFFRVFANLGLGHGISQTLERHIHDILWIAAVLTMVFGNLVALVQVNLKRILAYSSIAHTGYLLLGLVATTHGELGFSPGVTYLVGYLIMNLGAFAILTVISSRGDVGLDLTDLSGLSQRHPWLAFAMAVFLFSMAGIPPTVGFAAKYLIFYSAVQANEVPLVIIAVLCSAVSVCYYLRVLVYMYMRAPIGSPAVLRVPLWSTLSVAGMVFLTLNFGIIPEPLMDLARRVVLRF